MPTYKTSFNGKTLRLTADTPEQAATAARLYFAGRGQADTVAQEANARGQAAIRDKGLDDPLSPEFQALREQGQMQGTAEAGPYAAGIVGAGGLAGMAPAGLLPGLAKDAAIYGAAEVGEKALGLPSWTSEVIGAVSPGKQLLKWGLGKLGVGGAVKAAQTGAIQTAEREAAKAAERAAEKEAAQRITEQKLALEARKVAAREAESAAKIKALEETTRARIAAIERRAAGKAGKVLPEPQAATVKPDPDMIPDEAVSLVAEPLPFRPRGSVKPATNLGGPAKPGPAPTPDDKLAETLQASIDAAKAKKGAVRGKGTPLLEDALDTASGMHQRAATAGMTEAVADQRRRLGSQVVARKMGMGRHEVQSDAGTILNEALGEVSPVIPADRWAEIVSKMKSLPPEERVAYVARARGVKNMAQIENLRRTLETLGLLLPVGVAAASQE